eukprot:758609-Hanusia_phi.AAC.2
MSVRSPLLDSYRIAGLPQQNILAVIHGDARFAFYCKDGEGIGIGAARRRVREEREERGEGGRTRRKGREEVMRSMRRFS